MKFNPSPRVRQAIYLITGFGTPLVAYLLAKGLIGELEVALWSAEVLFASGLATVNVKKSKK